MRIGASPLKMLKLNPRLIYYLSSSETLGNRLWSVRKNPRLIFRDRKNKQYAGAVLWGGQK